MKLDAELKVLATVLANSAPGGPGEPGYSGLVAAESSLTIHYFSDPEARAIFGACQALAARRALLTPDAILAETGARDSTAMRRRVAEVYLLSHTEHARLTQLDGHITTLRACFLPDALERQLRGAQDAIQKGGEPEAIVRAFTETMQRAIESVNVQASRSADSVVGELLGELEDVWSGKTERKPFIKTQWAGLNEALGGGWYRGQNIIGARPGVGKTAIWESEAMFQAERNKVGVIGCSLEMLPKAHVLRMAIMRSQVRRAYDEIWAKNFDARRLLREALREIAQMPIQFATHPGEYDISTILRNIRATMRNWRHDAQPEVLVVDYGQLMKDEARQRGQVEEIGYCNRVIKDFATTEEMAYLCMIQLNRDNTKEGRPPRLSDLKGCGDLEQDAHNVVLPDRDPEQYERGQAQLCNFLIPKARSGFPGSRCPMEWIGEELTYRECEPSEDLTMEPTDVSQHY